MDAHLFSGKHLLTERDFTVVVCSTLTHRLHDWWGSVHLVKNLLRPFSCLFHPEPAFWIALQLSAENSTDAANAASRIKTLWNCHKAFEACVPLLSAPWVFICSPSLLICVGALRASLSGCNERHGETPGERKGHAAPHALRDALRKHCTSQ